MIACNSALYEKCDVYILIFKKAIQNISIFLTNCFFYFDFCLRENVSLVKITLLKLSNKGIIMCSSSKIYETHPSFLPLASNQQIRTDVQILQRITSPSQLFLQSDGLHIHTWKTKITHTIIIIINVLLKTVYLPTKQVSSSQDVEYYVLKIGLITKIQSAHASADNTIKELSTIIDGIARNLFKFHYFKQTNSPLPHSTEDYLHQINLIHRASNGQLQSFDGHTTPYGDESQNIHPNMVVTQMAIYYHDFNYAIRLLHQAQELNLFPLKNWHSLVIKCSQALAKNTTTHPNIHTQSLTNMLSQIVVQQNQNDQNKDQNKHLLFMAHHTLKMLSPQEADNCPLPIKTRITFASIYERQGSYDQALFQLQQAKNSDASHSTQHSPQINKAYLEIAQTLQKQNRHHKLALTMKEIDDVHSFDLLQQLQYNKLQLTLAMYYFDKGDKSWFFSSEKLSLYQQGLELVLIHMPLYLSKFVALHPDSPQYSSYLYALSKYAHLLEHTGKIQRKYFAQQEKTSLVNMLSTCSITSLEYLKDDNSADIGAVAKRNYHVVKAYSMCEFAEITLIMLNKLQPHNPTPLLNLGILKELQGRDPIPYYQGAYNCSLKNSTPEVHAKCRIYLHNTLLKCNPKAAKNYAFSTTQAIKQWFYDDLYKCRLEKEPAFKMESK